MSKGRSAGKKAWQAKREYEMRPPKHEYVEPGSFRGMSAARVRMAANAVGCDPEDTNDEDWAALDEYLALGGNAQAL